MIARAVDAWTKSYDPALSVRAGETLTLGRQDVEFPGWTWAVATNGQGGWLPEAVLTRTGPDSGHACEDFDTTELTIAPGQTLFVELERAGWAWCHTESGGHGWVPLRCLRYG